MLLIVTGYFEWQVVLKAALFVVIEDVLVHLVVSAGQCAIELGHGFGYFLIVIVLPQVSDLSLNSKLIAHMKWLSDFPQHFPASILPVYQQECQ